MRYLSHFSLFEEWCCPYFTGDSALCTGCTVTARPESSPWGRCESLPARCRLLASDLIAIFSLSFPSSLSSPRRPSWTELVAHCAESRRRCGRGMGSGGVGGGWVGRLWWDQPPAGSNRMRKGHCVVHGRLWSPVKLLSKKKITIIIAHWGGNYECGPRQVERSELNRIKAEL